MLRSARFAGQFYPKERDQLERELAKLFDSAPSHRMSPKAIVSPHAGYMYSGSTAACSYKAISKVAAKIDTFVIVGPNHTGAGAPVSISMSDWETPLGNVKNDASFSKALLSHLSIASADELAHAKEHSIEVQLPMLQHIAAEPKCAFICMMDQTLGSSRALAEAICMTALELKRSVIVIASSDFNHYESQAMAKSKDMPAIRALERLDATAFYDAILTTGDSACGIGPLATACMFAKSNKASGGIMLQYNDSSSYTGDTKEVVAYSSMAFC